jgi:ATP-binding cassette, subfamily B, bacterial CvaB/MchF/RaxB
MQSIWRRRSLKLIRQSESAECGLACLAMTLRYHGHPAGLRELRQHYGFSTHGATLYALVSIAREVGFRTRPVRIEVDNLALLELPCILHWNHDHFVVLSGIQNGMASIFDPARGVRNLSMPELAQHFTGVALQLTPTNDVAIPTAPNYLRLRQFVTGIQGLWGVLGIVAALLAVSQVALVVLPLFSKAIIDNVILGPASELLAYFLVAWLVAVTLHVSLDAIRDRFSQTVYQRYALNARLALFKHLFSLPLQYFERRRIAEINQRFRSLDSILSALTEGAATAFLDAAFCVMGLLLVFVYSGALAAITAVALFVLAFVMLRVIPRQNELIDATLTSSAKETGLLFESIRGVETLKLLGAEDRRLAQYRDAAKELTEDRTALAVFGITIGAAISAIQGLSQVVTLAVGAGLVGSGQLSLGALFAFQTYQHLVLSRFQSSLRSWSLLKNSAVDIERVADIICEPHEFTITESGSVRSPTRSHLECNNVHYAYSPHDPEVLSGVDLIVEPGECIVLVGRSGSGKTTLLKILAGLHKPTSGWVKVDGNLLSDEFIRGYRSQTATVMQHDELFAGSILENIAYPDEHPDEAKVREALSRAQIETEILSLPMGLRTRIGDMGSVLAAGQRQRLLIARALYRDPKFLLLDEATANLDPEMERRIVTMVAELPVTRVVVTHRPAFLDIADRVALLEDGRLTWRSNYSPSGPV